MQTIYKYSLEIEDRQTLSLPQLLSDTSVHQQILHVGVQNDGPVLWAMVDPALPSHDGTIRMFGTGQPCDVKPDHHIATLLLCNGRLVLHLFYE